MIKCSLCLSCWKNINQKRVRVSKNDNKANHTKDETSALLIGGLSIPDSTSAGISSNGKSERHGSPPEIVLDHHIFHSQDGWKKSESMAHPPLRLRLTTDAHDYEHLGKEHHRVMPSFVTVATDTGAQSCLGSLQDFYRCGFKDSDLSFKRTMLAANREEINIAGAIFVRLSGVDATGNMHTAPIMAYVSPNTEKVYLSREALVQLCVIPSDFPKLGAAIETSLIGHQTVPCGCPTRTLLPDRPHKLPFDVCSENIDKMKVWLRETFCSSTFNRCPHQVLKGVTGPYLHLHVDPLTKPKAVHTPSTMPLHWEKALQKQLEDDANLGVLERVPHGQPSLWYHRMVATRKPDGSPRRTVDMSILKRLVFAKPTM